jgi:hypothetical protein
MNVVCCTNFSLTQYQQALLSPLPSPPKAKLSTSAGSPSRPSTEAAAAKGPSPAASGGGQQQQQANSAGAGGGVIAPLVSRDLELTAEDMAEIGSGRIELDPGGGAPGEESATAPETRSDITVFRINIKKCPARVCIPYCRKGN